MSILIKGGTIVTDVSAEVMDLRITDEKITEIGRNISSLSEDKVIDASGKIIFPGIIDSHVHYKMAIDKVYTVDNFETGSRAALCGGVTTVIDYAEPLKGLTMTQSLKHRINEGKKHEFTDYSVHMTISGNMDYDLNDLTKFKEVGVNSLKLYTTYGFEMDYVEIEKILIAAEKVGMIVTIHSEDSKTLKKATEKLISQGKISIENFEESRPSIAEVIAVEKIIEICEKNNVSAHIVHVSSGFTAKVIGEAKNRGVKISGETCPHYLMLNKDKYRGPKAQMFVMQPPLRSEEERLLLWEMVKKGAIDFITTDHCAYDEHQKMISDIFYETNGGIPGTETLFPIMFSEGHVKRNISLVDLGKLLATNPAKKYGLYPRKGIIKVGSDGDITILDPDKITTISKDLIHSASDYSPFEGIELKGYPIMTILRGEIAYYNGSFLLGDPKGKFISIQSCKK